MQKYRYPGDMFLFPKGATAWPNSIYRLPVCVSKFPNVADL